MKEELQKEIVASLLEKDSSLLTKVIKSGFIPFQYSEKGKPLYGLYAIEDNSVLFHSKSKESFNPYLSELFGELVPADRNFNELCHWAKIVKNITTNPFVYDSFYYDSRKYKTFGVNVNDIKYSDYYYALESIKGDRNIDLILKSIRINDEINIDGLSLTEIAFAWQTFHTSKIMAIPCIYSEDRGIGKTTLALAGGYLYEDNTFFENVNMGDSKKSEYGDHEIGKRCVVYDDVPSDFEIVSALAGRVKGLATSKTKIRANKKGSAMVETNPYNQAVTTNYIYSIPLDDIGDRRIHPIVVHKNDYTDEESQEIINLNIPVNGDNDEYYPIIQDILNHLKYVYEETKNNPQVAQFLNKEVPQTKFKSYVALKKSSHHRKFEVLCLSALTVGGLVKNLNEEYGETESGFFNLLLSSSNAEAGKSKNSTYLYIKSDGLKSIGSFFDGSRMTAKDAQLKYFKRFDFKAQKVNGKTVRCIKLEMKNFNDDLQKEELEKLGLALGQSVDELF